MLYLQRWPEAEEADMRRLKRKLIAYTLCAVVFVATVLLALHLSRPPDPYGHRVRSLGHPAPAAEVETNKDLLKVKVGKDTYRYRLMQTDKGLVAAEEPANKQ